jgi:hypothetical protein
MYVHPRLFTHRTGTEQAQSDPRKSAPTDPAGSHREQTDGGAMNTRCTVCHHPQRREIEQDHVAGVTLRELAKKYGKGKSTIFKHINGHVPDAAQKAMRQ